MFKAEKLYDERPKMEELFECDFFSVEPSQMNAISSIQA